MAHWIIYERKTGNMHNMYKCSACGKQYIEFSESCPNCGAPMDEPHEFNKEKSETERFKEFLKQARQRKPGTFERYMNDVCTYLADKFPDADVTTVMDAASYISNRATIMCADLLWERDREWKRVIRQQSPKIKRRDEDEKEN